MWPAGAEPTRVSVIGPGLGEVKIYRTLVRGVSMINIESNVYQLLSSVGREKISDYFWEEESP